MITREQVFSVLKHINEPDLKKSLVEFQLIRDVMVREQNVSLTVILLDDNNQKQSQFKASIEEVLNKEGIQDIHIRFRPITEFERAELQKKLNGGQQQPAGQQPQGQQQTRSQSQMNAQGVPPLLQAESGVEFIAVASGKGGVGKSTVTVNLAVALARLGKKVGIIDADIYGFSVPDMMGIEERPQMEENTIIPVERHGVKVISMGFFVEDNKPVIWRGPMLGKMLKNFFSEVSWGELDYMLLDLPPGTGDVALDVHQMIPQSKEILVTTPHATAAFVAARAGSMALHTDHEILGVVENMAYYQCSACDQKDYVFGRGGGAKLAEELHSELLAQIPLGTPDNHPQEPDFSPSVYKEDSEIGQMYIDMARKISEKTQK
jgi:ATP-binding protein involved in chromosome partitioning